MKHELWKEDGGYTFCFAGRLGDQARDMLEPDARLIWAVEADSHFEAMTKYYQFMNWEDYRSDFKEDKDPYPDDWVKTQQDS